MPVIRDANTLIGYLERGETVRELSTELIETMIKLKRFADVSGPKAKIKGKVKLEIALEVQGDTVTIVGKVESKVPDRPRGTTVFFIGEDGEFSTEHPKQHDMFKPTGVPLSGEARMRASG